MIETGKNRLLLLDLLKVLTLLAIQTFHAWEFIFFEDEQIHAVTSWVYWPLSWYGRVFAIGGQILFSIVYLLFGLTGKDRKYFARIIPFALVGQMIITLAFMENGFFLESLEWDIYTFIAFSNLLLIISPSPSRWKLAGAFLLFLIPPSVWKEISPEGAVFDILTGRKSRWTSGACPPLPWFFLIYSFYNVGGLVREKKLSLDHWFRFERWVWAILLAASLPAWGFYIKMPAGPNFYFFVFHQDTYTFLANFLPFLLVIRMSFLTTIRKWSEDQKFFRWIGETMWARHVGLCYMVAIMYVCLGTLLEDIFRTVPFALDVFYLSIMPLTELIVRKFVQVRARIMNQFNAQFADK